MYGIQYLSIILQTPHGGGANVTPGSTHDAPPTADTAAGHATPVCHDATSATVYATPHATYVLPWIWHGYGQYIIVII